MPEPIKLTIKINFNPDYKEAKTTPFVPDDTNSAATLTTLLGHPNPSPAELQQLLLGVKIEFSLPDEPSKISGENLTFHEFFHPHQFMIWKDKVLDSFFGVERDQKTLWQKGESLCDKSRVRLMNKLKHRAIMRVQPDKESTHDRSTAYNSTDTAQDDLQEEKPSINKIHAIMRSLN